MEPSDLNSAPDRDEAQLEAWLRQPTAPLPDDGFSNRVLAALPPPTPARARWLRPAFCVAGAIVGAIVGRTSDSGIETWAQIQTALEPLRGALSDPAMLAAVTIAIVAALYALRPNALSRLIR
jgi:hypothetical protein